ncbi:MAG: hypothetical protein HY047_05115 [Acidobacteria bacterium]|nr:hypothetical protein [Acidobacteriota bacterium]
MSIPDAVRTLQRDLGAIFGPRLQSLAMYGQRARESHGGAHDHQDGHAHDHHVSLIQTMAVVDALTGDDLRACAVRVGAWHDDGLATPLLVVSSELDRSPDSFPLEFGAIQADHVVVSGANPFAALTVDPADVRRACEHQARSHLVHLREGFLETRGRADALAVLIVSSAAPFAALVMSVARLEGHPASDAAAAGRHAERTLGVAGSAITDVVQLVGVREISSADALRLFPPYLDAVERLVKYVDGWSGK